MRDDKENKTKKTMRARQGVLRIYLIYVATCSVIKFTFDIILIN